MGSRSSVTGAITTRIRLIPPQCFRIGIWRWNGNIENSYALEFISREYDLLVNYYTSGNLLVHLMSIKTRARFRVGLENVDRVYNDLIIDAPLKDFKTFKTELKKYLGVLNEI